MGGFWLLGFMVVFGILGFCGLIVCVCLWLVGLSVVLSWFSWFLYCTGWLGVLIDVFWLFGLFYWGGFTGGFAFLWGWYNTIWVVFWL